MDKQDRSRNTLSLRKSDQHKTNNNDKNKSHHILSTGIIPEKLIFVSHP